MPPLTPPAPPPRTGPAALTLMLLSPLCAEVLTGSTPPWTFLTNPVLAVLQIGFYGAGAVLVREIARRRGLGWLSVVLLGAAYGVLEEGLVITSWTNPLWGDVCRNGQGLCDYGRLLGVNWVWAISLTAFHAIVSITIPIILAEAWFPRIAARPWLGRKGTAWMTVSLAATSALQLLLFGFLIYQKQGYGHPPLVGYLLAVASFTGFLAAGLQRWPASTARPGGPPPRWAVRALMFVWVGLNLLLPGLVSSLGAPAAMAVAGQAVMDGMVALTIGRWAQSGGWNERYRLATASGALSFFIFVTAPIEELQGVGPGKLYYGIVLMALAMLVLLVVLGRRTALRLPAPAPEPVAVASR